MSFAHPSWLFLLALVPVLGIVAVLTARLRSRRWQAFVANRLRPALLHRTAVFGRWLSLLFLLVSVTLLVVTLAQPRGDAGTRSETVKGRNILFALDLSRSMRVDDVKPDRLSQGKAIIYEMMDAMPNDRMGLVGFAGKPYLFAPLTVDHGAVKETVEQLDETWIPTGGSDVVEALRFSIEALKKTGVHNNALVFISDGEKHDGSLDDVLADAAKAGVYIFAVGVGTENGDYVPQTGMPGDKFRDNGGRTVLSQMHPEILRQMAEKTKGRFVIAGSGVNIPALAQTALSGIDQFELEGREKKVIVEFYQWVLGPAIVFLLISILTATRWRPLATRTAVAATLAGTVTGSGAATPQYPGVTLTAGHFDQARQEYHDLADHSKRAEDAYRYRLGEGDAAYKGGEFRKAADAYSGALMSDTPEVERNAHLGAGTSLFHLGWQSLGTGETYPDPAPEDTQAFDALVKAKLKELAEKEVPDAGDTESYTFFNSLIVNWTDAIRHFNSALKISPGDKDATQNRALVVRYLDRLEELLKEQSDESQKQIPQQGPGEPKEKDGDQDGDGDGKPGDKDGKGGKDPKDQPGDADGDKKKDKGKGDDKDKKQRPGETPQERAKRILGENEDLQKGPVNPGRREQKRVEKDW